MNFAIISKSFRTLKRFFVNLPIRSKFILLLIPIVVLPLMVVSTAIQYNLSGYLTKQGISFLQTDIEKINIKFQSFIERTEKTSENLITSSSIQDSVNVSSNEENDSFSIVSTMRIMKNDSIDSILFINPKERVYSTNPYVNLQEVNFVKENTLKKLKETSGEMVWWYDLNKASPEDNNSFIYAARVVNHLDYYTKLGMMVFRIRPETIQELFSAIDKERRMYYFITDSSGRPILTANSPDFIQRYFATHHLEEWNVRQSGVQTQDVAGVKSLVMLQTNQKIGWNVVGIIPYEHVTAPIQSIQHFILFVSVLSVLVASIAAVLFAYSFTQPIKILIKHIRKLKNRQFDARLDLKRRDELGELAESYNSMSLEINTLIENIKLEQEHAKEAELKLLIDQINPHFLYNTLDNINMLALRSGDDRISLLITSLSKLLRLGLSKGEPTISLQDELDYARRYLLIQKMRYGDLFDFQVENPEASLCHIKVIKLMLQPLIENAIVHGFRNLKHGGQIRVDSYLDRGDLVFEVADNGIGVPVETLMQMNRGEFAKVEENRDGGYGLSNVNLRIKLLYGESYSMTFENRAPTGLVSRIRIPYKFLYLQVDAVD